MHAPKSDAQIQLDVLEELRLDPRVAETNVGVTVAHGVVTLTGTLPAWAMKMAAQEAAHRVEGVLDVANDLELQLPGLGAPNDTELAEHVRQVLVEDLALPAQRIRTTITRGMVTLEGEVDSAGQRDEAARVVRRVRGVTGLSNRLRVSAPELGVEEIQAAIASALQRQAKREAEHVQISVRDSSVTLTGTIHSWSERRAIIGTLRGVRGVDVIIDELHIAS
jgi:hyperosmotically inducible protein